MAISIFQMAITEVSGNPFYFTPEGHKECWTCRYKLEEEVKPEDKDAKHKEDTVSEMSKKSHFIHFQNGKNNNNLKKANF